MTEKFKTVDDYIASFPEAVQVVLKEVRRVIHAAIPGAGERISYQIPTVTVDQRPVVYFAGWKNHISIYPLPGSDAALDERLDAYRSGKGTAKFSLKDPIPYDLIGEVAGRLAQQRAGH